LSTSKIFNGLSEANIGTANGNANISINGTSNVAVFTSSGLDITGNISTTGNIDATGTISTGGVGTGNISGANVISAITLIASGNITGGNLNAAGLSLSGNVVSALVSAANITTTANIAANYFLGNGSQLTGLSSSKLANGTSNVDIAVVNGNITTGVNGTANVIVVSDTGQYVTGLISATGNITGGNITTGGIISITSNTVSTSISTGALVITASGGLGVGGAIYATQVFDGGSRVLTVDSTVDGGTF
jgi:hypothetical protein